MELLLVVLGALLAIGGGFLQQRLQQSLDQEKEENQLLFEAEGLLQRYHENRLRYADCPEAPVVLPQIQSKCKLELEEFSLRMELQRGAIRIKSRKNRGLALCILKFAIDEGLRTDEERSSLQEAVRCAINQELVSDYEAQE